MAGEPVASSSETATITRAAADHYFCDLRTIPRKVLTHGRPATELSPTGRAALRGRDEIIRRLPEPRVHRPGHIVTRELLQIRATRKDRLRDPDTWEEDYRTTCRLERDYPGFDAVDLRVDPDEPAPGPDSTTIPLEVSPRYGCSGSDAWRDIRVVETQVRRHHIGVAVVVIEPEPVPPGVGCSAVGHIFSHELQLPEPLGHRRLLDISVYPSQTILAAPAQDVRAGW